MGERFMSDFNDYAIELNSFTEYTNPSFVLLISLG